MATRRTRIRGGLTVIAGTLLMTGCFHQIVRTGAAPGNTVIERPWTATWVFGLVAADEIDAITLCPGGVSIIETQQSFLNGLVGVLTLGIFTPQTVTITCAGGGASAPGSAMLTIPTDAGSQQAKTVARTAIELAERTRRPVVLRDLR
jgi:hypothetical protein